MQVVLNANIKCPEISFYLTSNLACLGIALPASAQEEWAKRIHIAFHELRMPCVPE